MTSKLKKNIFYNIAYQLLNVALPLITIPYISRVLGVENNGIYSYTYSIVNYFMIFAMLGISNYGNRRIAKVRDAHKRLAQEFFSIYILQATLSVISILVYLVYCAVFAEYRAISFLEVLFLVSTLLDISWLYFGLEDFKTTVLRNSIVKILSVLLIFALVHQSSDLMVYTLIMGGSTLFSQIILWLGLKKHIPFSFSGINLQKITSHFKGILILFIPVISYSIYKIMDKIMLGIMYSTDEVAFYEYAEKIINIPIGIVNAVGIVMLPKISNLVSQQQTHHIQKYLYRSLELISFLSIPCCLGLIAISHNLAILFLGDAYNRTGIIIQFLSVTFLFTAWANVIRTQWLIPNEKDGIYISTTIAGALLNFVINLILIPQFGGVGASIGTVCSEFLIMFSQSFLSRKSIEFKKVARRIIHFAITGLLMFVIISIVSRLITNGPVCLFMQIVLGTIIYLLLNYRFARETIDNKAPT